MLFEDVAKYYEKLESVSSRLQMIDILNRAVQKSKERGAKKASLYDSGHFKSAF